MVYSKFIPYERKSCLIRINSYENKNVRGSLINTELDHETAFESHMHLFEIMDRIYDEINSPQRMMECRRFSETPKRTERKASDPTANPIATFKISVLFRQNASWQGTITWIEKDTEANFRSVLELMMLIDDALSEEQTTV